MSRDHAIAARLGQSLTSLGLRLTRRVDTNMVFFEAPCAADTVQKALLARGVLVFGGKGRDMRLVVHHQVGEEVVEVVVEVLGEFMNITSGDGRRPCCADVQRSSFVLAFQYAWFSWTARRARNASSKAHLSRNTRPMEAVAFVAFVAGATCLTRQTKELTRAHSTSQPLFRYFFPSLGGRSGLRCIFREASLRSFRRSARPSANVTVPEGGSFDANPHLLSSLPALGAALSVGDL
ncbi:hypothetical protein BDK51DRAFT_39175 [Blyttiomyces helicus]|uniref:Pyridoxal phosphate-dependent transferase n=1 Tax=Blyttiomyces helicus TaxID=388810 RepID=A0A4P9W8U2_9FUNG|nr:hypothetical protein BDK51DRAFT_39175 [Blyttiomyces helicus]|eukprot:RKO87508.1 hypothetical protein BDK51DRAFT_39175 [Blyttiomyces helicus]